jgi:2'-5' RNA ligase/endonuclease/exonuclease/phosphatase family metal-dependent hydrolase
MEKIEHTPLYTFECHDTALCAIPPRELWSSVDRLRCLYDKAYTAWPPHINIIYPFVRPELLENAAQVLRGNAIEHQPQVALDVADFFKHKHHNTIYLGQSSKDNVNQLAKLKSYISKALSQPQDSTDENFTPHMTIGQSEDAEAAPHHFLLEKARLLAPIAWQVREVAILVREPLAQSGSGPKPMKLWGTLNLESGTLTQTTQPQNFNDRLEEISRVTFQPAHCFSEPSKPLEKNNSPAHTPDATGLVLDRLVVASYNVLAEFEWPPQSHRHAPLVQNLLSAQAAADVVVLQEVTDHFLPDLLGSGELRGRYPYVSHGPPDSIGAEPLPSLLNVVVLSKFPFEWHHLPFQRKHKGCTVVRFPTIGTSDAPDGQFKSWILVACHLSQGLTDGAIATKKNEVQKMLDYLSATFPQNPWILAGDFNLVTSSHTIEAARKKQDISLQTVHRLQDIERALLDAGFIDTWLATRLESGESSDMNNERRSVLDSFQGEQGATFDPLTNTLTAELVGSGLNNRPQRYDKILVRTGHYHPHGFNMFGQTPFQATQGGHFTYASDHWGIRCLLLKSSSSEMSKAAVPAMTIKLQRPVPSLVEGEGLEHFLKNYGCLPTEQERATRDQAIRALEAALKDVNLSESEGDTRSGPPFIVVPVGSYGLGVWTSSSDIDCLCIGPFSSKTFFTMAVQRLKRAADIRILRRVKANSGYMLELEVHGIKVDLQYCAAASIAERYTSLICPAWLSVYSCTAD